MNFFRARLTTGRCWSHRVDEHQNYSSFLSLSLSLTLHELIVKRRELSEAWIILHAMRKVSFFISISIFMISLRDEIISLQVKLAHVQFIFSWVIAWWVDCKINISLHLTAREVIVLKFISLERESSYTNRLLYCWARQMCSLLLEDCCTDHDHVWNIPLLLGVSVHETVERVTIRDRLTRL